MEKLEILIKIILLVFIIWHVTHIIIETRMELKRNKQFQNWINESKKKDIEKLIKTEQQNINYTIALKSIKAIINQNPNGSLDNLVNKIKSMLPKDI